MHFYFTQQMVAVLCLLWTQFAFAAESGDYLRSARANLEKGEDKAAVLQLKNALLESPDNPEARMLLGKVYLKLQDGLSAEKELRRAQELGAAREDVLVPLGRALLMTGQGDKLLQTVFQEAGDPETLKIDILLLQGQACLATGNLAMAEDKFSMALSFAPSSAEALFGKARVAYQQRDAASATELVERALSSQPDYAEAWTLKGELLRNAGKPQEAIQAFSRALDINPDNLPARLMRATEFIALDETEQAKADIEWLLEKHANLYLVHYLKARVQQHEQQPVPAQESVQLALKQAPDHLPSHLLAGVIAYQLGQLNLAETHLRTYLKSVPDDAQVSKLLAATLLKLQRPGDAIEVLEPGLSSAVEDAQFLSLLGSAYMNHGNTVKGLEYLEQAAAIAPDVASIRTQLAIVQLAQGDIEKSISELRSAVDLGQDLLQADILLVIALLQRRDFDEALEAIDSLVAKMPDNPIPLNLKGAALLGKEDRVAARKAFEAALRLQPDFLPAHLNLAQIDSRDGNTGMAEARYRKVLSYDSDNLNALLALATLAAREGQIDTAGKWLEDAHARHPESIQPALLLLEHYLQYKEISSALDLAGAVAVAHPREYVVQKALAQVQMIAGKDKDALKTLRKLVEIAPESPEAHYLLAIMQVNQKETGAARYNLQQAIELKSDYPAAQLLLGRLYIGDKDYTAALDIAADLRDAHPDAAYGDELTGDVHAARNAYREASDSYALAYSKKSSATLAYKRYQFLLLLGESVDAHEALRQWLAIHPEDVTTRDRLAQTLLDTAQYGEAIDEYRKLLEYDPVHLSALNNLAWLYQEENNPEGIKYAERAYKLAPDRPEIIDTLGWLLVQHGDPNRGLVLLQEAAIKAPHIADIRYHMAAALEKAGRREEARKVLDRLLKSNKSFPERNKAEALRKQLDAG